MLGLCCHKCREQFCAENTGIDEETSPEKVRKLPKDTQQVGDTKGRRNKFHPNRAQRRGL